MERITQSFNPYVDISLGYITKWDLQSNSMAPIFLQEILEKSKSKNVRLGFITDGISLNWGGYPLNFADKVVKQLQDQNYHITLSLGGFSGVFPGENDNDVETILTKLEKIKNIYPNCDFCLDVENKNLMSNKFQLDIIMKSFKKLQQKSKNSTHYIKCLLTIPILPEGFTEQGKNVINSAYDADIDFKVNLMVMDYGADYANQTMFTHAKNAALNAFDFLKKFEKFLNSSIGNLIELTPMIGCNDTKPLIFTLEDAINLKNWVDQNGVGLSYWSLSRDNPGDKGEVSPIHSGIDQKPYEFAHIFNSGTQTNNPLQNNLSPNYPLQNNPLPKFHFPIQGQIVDEIIFARVQKNMNSDRSTLGEHLFNTYWSELGSCYYIKPLPQHLEKYNLP